MGAPIGFFSEENERDFPELNKCPDCETFFADSVCPICGKACPEEFLAGNRKPVKVKKRKRPTGNGRVQFVPWYLSTWFIILMLFVQPIVGLILIWMSDWRKVAKVLVTVLLILSYVGGFLLGGFLYLFDSLFYRPEIPVNMDLSKEEYVERCDSLSAETVYRNADQMVDEYVTLTLTVDAWWEDSNAYYNGEDYSRYLQCHVEENGKIWTFLVRDFRAEGYNFTQGDSIRIYGQIGGNMRIENEAVGVMSAPGINMLYAELLNP